VVASDNSDESTLLDGFTITKGNANGDAAANWDKGAGLYVRAGSPSVIACTITGNIAEFGGGAYTNFANTTFAGCLFVDNASTAISSHGGGGMHNLESHIELVNCFFRENRAMSNGGAIDNHSTNLTVRGCTLVQNYSHLNGGAIAIIGHNPVSVVNSIFGRNTSRAYGGAVHETGGSHTTFSNCTLVGNIALNSGGGMRTSGAPTLVNCLFCGNLADMGSALVSHGGTTLVNCTFANNASKQDNAGAVNCLLPTITNCLLWGNSNPSGSEESAQLEFGAPAINYSTVQGWTGALGGTGNIGDDPLFVGGASSTWTAEALYDPDTGVTTLVDSSATWQLDELIDKFLNPATAQHLQSIIVGNTATEITVLGDFSALGTTGVTYQIHDYHLSAGSPCIDAADNTAVPTDVVEPIPVDLDGSARFVDDLSIPDTGVGPPPIVDIGAYEFGGDCNGNGIVDLQDIDIGTSQDCDGNGVPDECQPDCDNDDTPDVCELPPFGSGEDCNINSIPDECDLTDGASYDDNGNWVWHMCRGHRPQLLDR